MHCRGGVGEQRAATARTVQVRAGEERAPADPAEDLGHRLWQVE